MKKDSSIFNVIALSNFNHIFLIFESLITGCLTGFVIAAFRISIDYISKFRCYIYSTEHKGILFFILLSAGLSAVGILAGWIIKKYPMVTGGGVAQIEGVFMQKLKLSPLPELPLKFIAGVLDIGLGLSVGREGPSVQIGAYIGDIIEKIGKRSFVEKTCLITAGAAAGLSAAFNAPFAGVVFALEDLHQYFSPLLLECVMAGAFAADFVVSSIFGIEAIFNFHGIENLPVHEFSHLIGLGIAIAVIGHFFKKSIYCCQYLYKNLNVPLMFRPVIPFLISIPACIFLTYIVSGGDEFIETLIENSSYFTIPFLAAILTAKIIFTGLSAGSGAVGGIFVPLFACGAAGGAIYAKILIYFELIDPKFVLNFMIFGMAACFTTVIKAPLTAGVLLFETCGSFYHLGGLLLTCLSSYITAHFLNSQPHDHILLEQILASNEKENKLSTEKKSGTDLFEIYVGLGSYLSDKTISQIKWPESCLIVGITRSGTSIIPNGKTTIYAGDKLIVLSDNADIEKTLEIFTNMSKHQLVN